MAEILAAAVLMTCGYVIYTHVRINRATSAMNRNTERMNRICDEMERANDESL